MNTNTGAAAAATAKSVDIGKLNDLIETLKDGEAGFRAAAEDVKRADLKEVFHNLSQQRAGFAAELQSHVEQQGEHAESTGSIAGAAHRGWINLKAAVSGREDIAVLEECERGEDVAVATYKTAMESGQLGAASEVVARQYTAVQAAHDRIRGLRDSNKASA